MVSINRKLVVAGSSGFVLGTIMWFIGAVALTAMATLPPASPYVGFIIGFGGAVAAMLSEDIAEKAGINRKLVVAGASGFVLGTILWYIGAIATTVMIALPATTPYVAFIIGFGGAVAATLSEDAKPSGQAS